MTQYQLTIDEETLHGLFEGDKGLARLLQDVLNQILEAQATDHVQAAPYERTPNRRAYRHGYRTREMKTRVGPIELKVPRTRDGSFSPEMFSRYQRSEQALVLALMEMVINGVSTRKVRRITDKLCGTSFSRSTVSNLCKQLDQVVTRWNNRPLTDRYPFCIVDAMQLKIRIDQQVLPQSAFIAIGINGEGKREVLGLMVGDSESEASWSQYFSWLKERGLSGVDLVVSDDHKGLVKAAARHFQGVGWQRCQTHLKRNVLDKTPKKLREELASRLRLLFDAPDMATARQLLEQTAAQYASKAPRAIDCLEAGFDDATAVMVLPVKYRRRLRSTNILERLNREVRRRERVVGIFPGVESAARLLGAYLMELDEEWTVGRKYFDMTDYWEWKNPRSRALTDVAD